MISALENPLRREILKHIVEIAEPVSPDRVSRDLQRGLSNVGYHVRVLRDAGALLLVDKQPVRGSKQHYYMHNATVTGETWVREVLDMPPLDGAEH